MFPLMLTQFTLAYLHIYIMHSSYFLHRKWLIVIHYSDPSNGSDAKTKIFIEIIEEFGARMKQVTLVASFLQFMLDLEIH